MPKKFYLIGHNPNTLDKALNCLRAGGNALEPDVRYKDGTFYVGEKYPVEITPVETLPRLIDYLNDLKNALYNEPGLNLALIAFDLKEIDYDINDLYDVIRNNFCYDYPDIAILTTYGHPDGMLFLSKIVNQQPFEAIGIDMDISAEDSYHFFSPTGLNFTYANGTSSSWPIGESASHYAEHYIKPALEIKTNRLPNPFKLVYAWTWSSDGSVETYLDIDVDGIITDDIANVKSILDSDKYKDKYVLAQRGYNPFAKDFIV